MQLADCVVSFFLLVSAPDSWLVLLKAGAHATAPSPCETAFPFIRAPTAQICIVSRQCLQPSDSVLAGSKVAPARFLDRLEYA